jgi:hypothetical protein
MTILTRQAISEYLGVEMQFHPELLKSIAAFPPPKFRHG